MLQIVQQLFCMVGSNMKQISQPISTARLIQWASNGSTARGLLGSNRALLLHQKVDKSMLSENVDAYSQQSVFSILHQPHLFVVRFALRLLTLAYFFSCTPLQVLEWLKVRITGTRIFLTFMIFIWASLVLFVQNFSIWVSWFEGYNIHESTCERLVYKVQILVPKCSACLVCGWRIWLEKGSSLPRLGWLTLMLMALKSSLTSGTWTFCPDHMTMDSGYGCMIFKCFLPI